MRKTRKRSSAFVYFAFIEVSATGPAISRGLGAAGPFQLTITSFSRFTKGFAISKQPRDETTCENAKTFRHKN